VSSFKGKTLNFDFNYCRFESCTRIQIDVLNPINKTKRWRMDRDSMSITITKSLIPFIFY
jgi:hypothetical protein